MKLPRRDLPNYTTILPISLAEVSFRPYTVKEEKILMQGVQSGERADKIEALNQLIESCSSLDTNSAHPTDIEWLFLRIRSCSVSSLVDLSYSIAPQTCGQGPDNFDSCPQTIKTCFDINDAVIENINEMEKYAIKRGDKWLVMIDVEVGLQFKIKTSKSAENALYELVECIIDGQTVIPKSEFTPEEFDLFLEESFTPKDIEPVIKFLDASPYTSVNIAARCSKCKKDFSYKMTDIASFLV